MGVNGACSARACTAPSHALVLSDYQVFSHLTEQPGGSDTGFVDQSPHLGQRDADQRLQVQIKD